MTTGTNVMPMIDGTPGGMFECNLIDPVSTKSREEWKDSGMRIVIDSSAQIRMIAVAVLAECKGKCEVRLMHNGDPLVMSFTGKQGLSLTAQFLAEPNKEHEFCVRFRKMKGLSTSLVEGTKMRVLVEGTGK